MDAMIKWRKLKMAATSRWTLSTCWSGKHGSDCETPKTQCVSQMLHTSWYGKQGSDCYTPRHTVRAEWYVT